MPSPVKKSQVIDCGTCAHRSSRMFCNLAAPALDVFVGIGSNCVIPEGATLFRERALCEEAFVLCTGQVKLFCTSKLGKSIILKVAHPGDVLGLSAMIAGTRHEVTAEALDALQVKRVRKAEFIAFLTSHGQASLHATQALSIENNNAFLDVRRLAGSGSAAGNLATLLLNWGHKVCCRDTEMRFPMTLTHEELAALTGVSRETVTRTLRQFQERELIQIAGYSLRVLSPSGLEDISS